LSTIYKEKYGEPFRFLPCYFFLRDKPKFLTLVNENGENDSQKHSIGGKDQRPIGNKRAKQLKQIEDLAEHLGSKIGIVKTEPSATNNAGLDNAKNIIGKAINEFTSMACSGFESWQQSIFLQHASDDMKRQLADTQLKKEILHLEKENSEKDATTALMQLTSTATSSTSSLSNE